MSRTPGKRGAERETEFPPFGNQELRREWAARAAALPTLDEALAALLRWRASETSGPVVTGDARWIEARLEERVAVLRFRERSFASIQSEALTGEPIAELSASFLRRAENATPQALEALAAELRLRFKPPVLPTTPYLRLEATLSELLMKARSGDWFGPSLAELRRRRGVVVRKEGLPS